MSSRQIRAAFAAVWLLGVAAAPSMATAPAEFEQLMNQGHDARLKGQWEDALKSYQSAWDLVKSGSEAGPKADSALQCALANRALADQVPEKSKDYLAQAKTWYDLVIKFGDAKQGALAANNLAVLYLDGPDADPQKAVTLFRKYVFGNNQADSSDDAFAYHFNFARALEKNNELQEARTEYWKVLELRPQVQGASEGLRELLLKEQPPRYTDAVQLVALLLNTGQSPLAGKLVHEFLKRWGTAPETDHLLPLLLRYFEASGMGPDTFQSGEQAALADVRKIERLTATVEELERLFLEAYFAERLATPLVTEQAQVFDHFPRWSKLMSSTAENGKATTKTFSLLLKRAADFYYRQSFALKEGTDQAARQALIRYSASWMLDHSTTDSALYAANVLREHTQTLDPNRNLYEKLVATIINGKGDLIHKAETKEDWVNVYGIHVVLADLFQNQGFWGSVDDRKGALFMLNEALRDQKLIQAKYDSSFRAAPRLYASLGKGYQETGNAEQAWEHYLKAAEGYSQSRNSVQAKTSLRNADNLIKTTAYRPSAEQLKHYDTLVSHVSRPSSPVLRAVLRQEDPVRFVAIFKDGKTLASTGGQKIKLWSLPAGKEQHQISLQLASSAPVAIAPTGKYCAGASGTRVQLWEVDTGRLQHTLEEHKAPVTALAFSFGGRTLASADRDGNVLLWDADTNRKQSPTLKSSSSDKHCLALSPNGRLLALGTTSTVFLWDIPSGKLHPALRVHAVALSFSSDNSTLATGNADGTIGLWNVASGKEQHTLRGHGAPVQSVAFSANGKQLASGSADGTIKVWDPASGREQKSLNKEIREVLSLAFTPDGKILAVGGRLYQSGGGVALWNID